MTTRTTTTWCGNCLRKHGAERCSFELLREALVDVELVQLEIEVIRILSRLNRETVLIIVGILGRVRRHGRFGR